MIFTMVSLLRFLGLFAFSLVAMAPNLHASTPRFMQAYGAWDTYVFAEGGSQVCYMASRPQKAEGNYTRRGEIYAYITHRPGKNMRDVFGYVTGYSYKGGSEASLTIDGKSYSLFTQGDKAWALDLESDSLIANAVQKGSKMQVRGVSARGTKTVDTFSLKGSSKAYQRITKECGL